MRLTLLITLMKIKKAHNELEEYLASRKTGMDEEKLEDDSEGKEQCKEEEEDENE